MTQTGGALTIVLSLPTLSVLHLICLQVHCTPTLLMQEAQLSAIEEISNEVFTLGTVLINTMYAVALKANVVSTTEQRALSIIIWVNHNLVA